jgi:hypothetical protein
MAHGKGKAQEQYSKPTRQGEVRGLQHNCGSLLMIRAITFIMGRGLIVILRRGEWNKLTRHPKDHRKNQPKSRMNSLQHGENDVG